MQARTKWAEDIVNECRIGQLRWNARLHHHPMHAGNRVRMSMCVHRVVTMALLRRASHGGGGCYEQRCIRAPGVCNQRRIFILMLSTNPRWWPTTGSGELEVGNAESCLRSRRLRTGVRRIAKMMSARARTSPFRGWGGTHAAPIVRVLIDLHRLCGDIVSATT